MAEIKLPIGFPKKELTQEEKELDEKILIMSTLVKLTESLPKNNTIDLTALQEMVTELRNKRQNNK